MGTSTWFRRRQWHPTPVLLPGKSHGQRSLVGCSPLGCQESDMTNDQKILMIIWQKPSKFCFVILLLKKKKKKKKLSPPQITIGAVYLALPFPFTSNPSKLQFCVLYKGLPWWLRWQKRLSTMWETQFQSLGWEDPLERERAILSSTIAWKIPWTEEPGRLQSMGSQRVGFDLMSKQQQQCQDGGSQRRCDSLLNT